MEAASRDAGPAPVVCWTCDVGPLADPTRFARGMAALPWADRREKVMAFRFDRDRRLCLGAGLLLAHALRRAGAKDLALCRLPGGKPALANDPEIHFNLSHSGSLAACAVSRQPVGVDAQAVQPADPGVSALCFQPRERAWIDRSDDPDRAFTRLWTRKESWLKLLGTGLSRSPDTFCALPGEPMADGSAFAEGEMQGHLICVCTHHPAEIHFREWKIDIQ